MKTSRTSPPPWRGIEIDAIEQLSFLLNEFGIHTHIVEADSQDTDFDLGLRKFLKVEYDYRASFRECERFYEDAVLYIVKDNFECCYLSFSLPREGQEPFRFVQIGPIIEEAAAELVDKVIEENHIPGILYEELLTYYTNLPRLDEGGRLEHVILRHMGYLFPNQEIRVNRIGRYYRASFEDLQNLTVDSEHQMTMELIEMKYQLEDEMIAAVRTGDMEQVLLYRQKLSKLHDVGLYDNILQKGKELLFVQNTLLRKAVQKEAVHPIHIDKLSELMVHRIEQSQNTHQLRNLADDMIRKYCLLITNHSLRGYSAMIRKALNYIEFHMQENLRLHAIAGQISVNASYLSSQFKKEVGKSVTEYVNETRVNASFLYLATTSMPVAEIAEFVGIYDENYFSKLFKKRQGMTPSEYRRLMQR